MEFANEVFGSADKVALMRRGAAIWKLVGANPRFSFYGRLVELCEPEDDTASILKALATVQGAGVAHFFPKSAVADLFRSFEEDGFQTDRHEHYYGGKRAYDASRDALAKHALPSDLDVIRLDARTSVETVRKVAQLCQDCDVMPIPGAFMRGVAKRGVCIAATDSAGDVVGCVSSIFPHNSDSLHAEDVFWGAMAIREDRRGQKIGLILGALAIVHMWEIEGARGFMTGVRKDNDPSQSICTALGVADSDWVYAQCINPRLLGGGSVTK